MNVIASWTTIGMGGFGGQGGQGGQQSSPVMMIGWLAIMVGLFYFMMIRPQQRKEKERRALIAGVKSGDRVVFGGGLIGTVSNIRENVLVVKVAENTKLEVLRASVTRVIQKDENLDANAKE
ncbi:MAG: preprotein translocase subunit YajC [Kiritimatiellia bacterium]|jgi:preprotein translocase subunit YajC